MILLDFLPYPHTVEFYPMSTLGLLLAAFSLSAWFSQLAPQAGYLQGYVEGEFLYLAVPVAGYLETLAVQRGDTVQAGEPLFGLSPQPESDSLREAEHRLQAAQARLADLGKGQRPAELAAIEARLAQAQADLAFARKELERHRALYKQRMIQAEAVDASRAEVQRGEARIAEIQAQLESARLGGREDALATAQAELATARAALDQARWKVEQKRLNAPQGGQVVEIFRYPGEWVAASQPVLSLLPPERIKLRFFLPEPVLGAARLGQRVGLRCDACAEGLEAVISYISPRPEYTPPVIYNRDNRARLVYLLEATPSPEIARQLHPGQPVEVKLGE
jgi:HlyD family secretion protein